MRLSPPRAVVPSVDDAVPSARTGLAPAQSGTVSRCVENNSRGPGRVPGRSTSRLPVSVGSGIRWFTVSKRIAEAGTPAATRASLTAAAIAASWPVTPSTSRNLSRCCSAASTSNGIGVAVIIERSKGEKWTEVSHCVVVRRPAGKPLQPPGDFQHVPRCEQSHPDNGHPDRVGQQQRHDRADTGVLVVPLGKAHD